MKCNKCEKNATTHIRQNINGNVTEQWLCSECAEKAGVGGMFSGFGGFGSFASLDPFEGILSSFFGTPNAKTLPSQTRCSVCGSTFSDIKSRGKVGCANCYEVFGSQLRPTVEHIHGRVSHVGKMPGKSAPAASQKPAEADKTAGAESVESLRTQLKKAVENEEYEKAAQLRDRIKELESE